jgi:hypothetical protein
LKHQKQWKLPFVFGLLWTFKCYNCNLITTNEQLKYLTHVLCLMLHII